MEYVRFLMMLWHLYSILESALEKHSTDPILSPTYDPALLSRTSRLSADISYLLGIPDDDQSWKSNHIHAELIASPPDGFKAYTKRLSVLCVQEPSMLLAHSYVRYLGDLSGGQTVKWQLQKAYELNDESGRGLRFYDFEAPDREGLEVKQGKVASAREMKRVKAWFRNGMDNGVGDDRKLKEALLDEAIKAYELTAAIFASLRSPSNAVKEANWVPSTESTYSVSSVVAFMLAVGLAHFILVVGGFTGGRGYAKLELALGWCTELISWLQ